MEASLLAILLPGGGTLLDLARGRPLPEPQPIAIFLVKWLLFRLLFESGLAKIEAGKDTWLNLTAMTYYYETAPLPSWGGWLVQQFPLWFHQLSVFFTFFVELPLSVLIFLPRRFRLLFFAIHLPFQLSIGLTSNYGFFNLLSIVLSLSCLEDRDLDAAFGLADRLLRPRRPGAAVAQREFLLFLNNDVLASQPTWLEAMLECAGDPRVGIVGATLLYLIPSKLAFFNNKQLLLFGLALILMMRFRPEGLVPSRRRQLEFHEEEIAEAEAHEVVAADAHEAGATA